MKRLLLDTHALLWWLADDASLSAAAREAIAAPVNEALVSAASAWEIAIKRARGKLRVPATLLETVSAEGFNWLAIEPQHAWAAGELPDHHRDPFDRLLVAQALAEEAVLISNDPQLAAYGVEICW